jgi:hypothetical protein
MKRRTFIFVALGLLVWALIASLIGAYYYSSYNDLLQKTRKATIHVNLGINYGNDTVHWFNNTEARSGDTMLDLTMQVAEVNYTSYPTGAFVTAIDNVDQPATKSWIWWTWTAQFGWSLSSVGSDKYVLGDGETVYWYFVDTSTWPPSPPS